MNMFTIYLGCSYYRVRRQVLSTISLKLFHHSLVGKQLREHTSKRSASLADEVMTAYRWYLTLELAQNALVPLREHEGDCLFSV